MKTRELNEAFEEWWAAIHCEGYGGTSEEKRIAYEAFHEGARLIQSRVRSAL